MWINPAFCLERGFSPLSINFIDLGALFATESIFFLKEDA